MRAVLSCSLLLTTLALAVASEPGKPNDGSGGAATSAGTIQKMHVVGGPEARAVKIKFRTFSETPHDEEDAAFPALIETELDREGFIVVDAPSEADAVLTVHLERGTKTIRVGQKSKTASGVPRTDWRNERTTSYTARLELLWPNSNGNASAWKGTTADEHLMAHSFTTKTLLKGIAKDAAKVIRNACDAGLSQPPE